MIAAETELHDRGIEAALLGCFLVNAPLIGSTEVVASAFFHKSMRSVYDACLAEWRERREICAAFVANRLRKSGASEEQIGMLMVECLDQNWSPGASAKIAPHYASQIGKLAYNRKVLLIDQEARERRLRGWKTEDIEDYQRDEYRKAKDLYLPDTSEGGYAEALAKEIEQRKAGSFNGTGYPNIDYHMGNVSRGSVITIVAKSGVGKSIVASNIIVNGLKVDSPEGILFASLEMSETLTYSRLVKQFTGMTDTDLRRQMEAGEMDPRQLEFQRISDERLCVHAKAGSTIASIRGAADRWEKKRDRKIRMIVIDYLQYVKGRQAESRYAKTSAITAEVKELAKDLEAVVILLSQVKRTDGDESQYKSPGLEDARDSGTIEENADVMLGLWRDKNDNTLILTKALKVRDGGEPGGKSQLVCDWSTGRLSEATLNF